jgi:small subunit ribosomal protein S16
MLKLRLKKIGRKRQPSYRLVVMDVRTRRDGRPIEEVGYYNPLTKEKKFETDKIVRWLENGVKPTETVRSLLRKAKILTAE